MKKIVFLDSSTIDPCVHIPSPKFAHSWCSYENTEPDQVLERLSDKHIAVSKKVHLHSDILRELPKLEHIAVTSTGMNHVDVNYCQSNGIHVSNVKGYGAEPVSEHAMMMLLALRRNLPKYIDEVNNGAWESSTLYCHYAAPLNDLSGTTIAIVGKGDIGQALAVKATAFGMRILFAERKGAALVRDGYTQFQEAIGQADHIVLCCPLNEHTRDLIGGAELSIMKSNVIIINVARGGIVDESAVVDALLADKIAGVATDVAEFEPLRSDSPLGKIKNHPRAIITPHIAWASISGQEKLMQLVIQNLEEFEERLENTPTSNRGKEDSLSLSLATP